MYYLDAMEVVADSEDGWATVAEVADSLDRDGTEASNALRRAWERRYLKRRQTRNESNQPVWEYALTARGDHYLLANRDSDDDDWE